MLEYKLVDAWGGWLKLIEKLRAKTCMRFDLMELEDTPHQVT